MDKEGIDLSKDKSAETKLRDTAERVKNELSTSLKRYHLIDFPFIELTRISDVNLPYITSDASGPKHMQMSITRNFLELVSPLFQPERLKFVHFLGRQRLAITMRQDHWRGY